MDGVGTHRETHLSTARHPVAQGIEGRSLSGEVAALVHAAVPLTDCGVTSGIHGTPSVDEAARVHQRLLGDSDKCNDLVAHAAHPSAASATKVSHTIP